jgi:hypothetical protein
MKNKKTHLPSEVAIAQMKKNSKDYYTKTEQ